MARSSRLPTAARREQIALAALRILGEGGLSALSTAALAEAVGLTSGALFRHFASREAILEEAARLAVAALDETLPDPGAAASDRLRALGVARVRLLSSRPGIAWLLRSARSLAALPPGAGEHVRGVATRSRRTIRAALKEGMADGTVRGDVPLDVLMLVFTSTVHALAGQPGLQGRSARSAAPERAINEVLTLLAPHRMDPQRRAPGRAPKNRS